MSAIGAGAGPRPPSAAALPRRSIVALLYGGFFLTGVATVLLGPLIPELETSWGIGHAEVASLFVAQFVASSLGAVVSGFYLRGSLIGGYALISLGLLTLAAGGWPLARMAMAVLGAGLGMIIPATNLWTAHAYGSRRGAALAVLNLFWGLGAVSCPLLFALLLDRRPATHALWALAALTAGVAVSLLARDGRSFETPAPPDAEPAARPTRALALLAAMLFLYVGIENAVGGWLVTLADQIGGRRSAASLLIGSGFWGALLAGRAASPALLRRIREPTLYAVSLAVAGCGVLILLLGAGSRAAVATGAVLAGLGLAALFPLTVSLLAERTAANRSRTTGWVFAFGGCGGAALPWLTGRAESELPGRGFVIPLAGLALLAALFALRRRTGADPGRVDSTSS